MELDIDGIRTVMQDAEAVCVTDGQGRLVTKAGQLEGAPLLAESLDLILGSIAKMGEEQACGGLELALLTYAGRSIIVAKRVNGGHVSVVASASVKPGLLLSYVRRLAGQESVV